MEELGEVKKFLHSLSPADYCTAMREIHVAYPNRSKEITNKIVNSWRNTHAKEAKAELTPETTSTSEKPEASSGASGQGSKLVSSTPAASLPWQQSAWKSGFIFRGDKIPKKGLLVMDVEKVTLKIKPGMKKHEQRAATVAVVNGDGKLVLWAFVNIPHDQICQYAPKITNLSERKLGAGVSLDLVKLCLEKCLQENRLVGARLNEDLESLGYSKTEIMKLRMFDIQNVYRNDAGPFALGLIAKKLLLSRSGFQVGHHSAIDDARMTLAAYQHFETASQNGTFESDIRKLQASRSSWKAEKVRVTAEKCLCAKK